MVAQVLAISCMILTGFLVSMLAIMTTPENFVDATQMEISDLGAVRFLLATILLLLIPWYRKIPLVLIIAGGFHAVVIQGDPFVLAVGLTVWIVRAERRWQWIVAGTGLLAILINIGWHVLALLRMPSSDVAVEASIVAVLTIGFLTLGTVLATSLLTRQRRRIEQADATVVAVEHDRDNISTQMTRQTEREYLAREVHDTLAQRLTALSLQTGQMQRHLTGHDDAELATALQATRQYSDQALRDLRNLVTTLRDHGEKESTVPSVAPDGFDDLKRLFDDASDQGLVVYPLIVLNGYDTAPDELQRAVLRITQEALTNVMRHSPDQTVQLRFEGQPGEELRMEFMNRRDTQATFDAGSGTGILGITERAELLGGNAHAELLPEYFRLTIRLPWQQEQTAP
ncbi:signal transduction histidine kinase [Enteractinococcus coprophilus]|uniref:histidine kinase n=2 Tax=Enteractinococcus coprophilus TaxID=1027633 RepID=A0A542ZYQ0_9MICC|nr:signal transduction histidine kinase [Enteractinococcus coprophilus]